jgi:hypothetical protein
MLAVVVGILDFAGSGAGGDPEDATSGGAGILLNPASKDGVRWWLILLLVRL